MEGFARFAAVSGADDEAVRAARAIAEGAALGVSADEAAARVKSRLVAAGVRDQPEVFTLDEMIAQRGGNCLGLTLFIGAALREAGHQPMFVLRRNPFDDVHAAGEEHFALLCDPDEGVDEDSRLPDAADCTSRFRFIPVEHASLELDGTPFEATTLARETSSTWTTNAESIERIGFDELCATVWLERSKMLLRAQPVASNRRSVGLRRAIRLALRGLREAPGHREGWADLWRMTRTLSSPMFERIAKVASARYAAFDGRDSLFAFTRYRMTGATRHLDDALARFPSYAEAYFEKHVVLARDPAEARVGIARTAWMIAESEILDLERFYREHADAIARAFSEAELEELLASFSETTRDDAHSRAPS